MRRRRYETTSRTRFTEVVATHTSRANPYLMAWSGCIQDETGLVRNEGCDMGGNCTQTKGREGCDGVE